MSRTYITGFFSDESAASEAVQALLNEGFAAEEIAILQSDIGGVHAVDLDHKTGIQQGAIAGGALGATLGAAGTALVSVGAISAPPLGLLVAGPLVAALKGGVVGAAGGSLLGTLAGLGFWKEEPDLPHELETGAVLVGVPASGGRRLAARDVFNAMGAKRIQE